METVSTKKSILEILAGPPTSQELRDVLALLKAKGVPNTSVADRAGVSRACVCKFVRGHSEYLRSTIFTSICSVVRSDAQRLRL